MTTRYRRYLASRAWALKRLAVHARARDGQICERCHEQSEDGSKIIAAVHHLDYSRTGNERLEDLQGVCEGCHKFLGGFSDVDPIITRLRRKEAECRQFAADLQEESANRAHDAHLMRTLADEIAQWAVEWAALSPQPDSWIEWQYQKEIAEAEAAGEEIPTYQEGDQCSTPPSMTNRTS